MTNGVFAMPKVKVQRQIFDSKPRPLCNSARELPNFSNSTRSEAKQAIIREDEFEGDTEELYQSVFTKTEETCPFAM